MRKRTFDEDPNNTEDDLDREYREYQAYLKEERERRKGEKIIAEENEDVRTFIPQYKNYRFYPAIFKKFAGEDTELTFFNLSEQGRSFYIAVVSKFMTEFVWENVKKPGSRRGARQWKEYQQSCDQLKATIEALNRAIDSNK